MTESETDDAPAWIGHESGNIYNEDAYRIIHVIHKDVMPLVLAAPAMTDLLREMVGTHPGYLAPEVIQRRAVRWFETAKAILRRIDSDPPDYIEKS